MRGRGNSGGIWLLFILVLGTGCGHKTADRQPDRSKRPAQKQESPESPTTPPNNSQDQGQPTGPAANTPRPDEHKYRDMMGWWLRAVTPNPTENAQEIDAINLNTKTGYVSNMAAFIPVDRQRDFSWDFHWVSGSDEPETMRSGDGWAEFGKFRLVLLEDGVASIEGNNDRWIFVGPALPQSLQELRSALKLW